MTAIMHKAKTVLLFIAGGLVLFLVVHWFVRFLLILVFVLAPLSILNELLLRRRNLPKRIDFKMESESWFVDQPDMSALAFLKALLPLFPEGSILCVNSDHESVRKFLASKAMRVELGVSWFWQKLRPVVFHLPLDMVLIEDLSPLLKNHHLGGIFEIFAIYVQKEVYLYAPATCGGGMLFSKKLEEEKLKRFFAEVGCKYE